MILKIFLPKKLAKNLAFLTRNKAKFWKKFIITLVFKKNANYFAENWEKSQKIVIITSTPGNPGVENSLVRKQKWWHQSKFGPYQGDQIGRIFASWATVCFEQF
jgi:hypothetical protein